MSSPPRYCRREQLVEWVRSLNVDSFVRTKPCDSRSVASCPTMANGAFQCCKHGEGHGQRSAIRRQRSLVSAANPAATTSTLGSDIGLDGGPASGCLSRNATTQQQVNRSAVIPIVAVYGGSATRAGQSNRPPRLRRRGDRHPLTTVALLS